MIVWIPENGMVYLIILFCSARSFTYNDNGEFQVGDFTFLAGLGDFDSVGEVLLRHKQVNL
jgi:hypothetical protein